MRWEKKVIVITDYYIIFLTNTATIFAYLVWLYIKIKLKHLNNIHLYNILGVLIILNFYITIGKYNWLHFDFWDNNSLLSRATKG